MTIILQDFKCGFPHIGTLQRRQLYSSLPGRAQCGQGGSKVVKVGAGPLQIDKFNFGNYYKVKKKKNMVQRRL